MHTAHAARTQKQGGLRACLPAAALLTLSLPVLLVSVAPVSTSEPLVAFRPGVSAREAFLLATGAGASVIGPGAFANSVVVAPGADAVSLREAGALLIIAAAGFLCGSTQGAVR